MKNDENDEINKRIEALLKSCGVRFILLIKHKSKTTIKKWRALENKVNFMSINYAIVKREIHVGANPGTKYLPRIVRNNVVDLDRLADEISNATTVSDADCLAVLKAMQRIITDHLTQSETIHLGILGNFSPCLKVVSKATKAEVNVGCIKRVYCNFKPSMYILNRLNEESKKHIDTTITGVQ